MKFLRQEHPFSDLTYEDVYLVPQYSEVESRMDVDLAPTDGLGLTLPVVVANMMSVAGKRMAETVTRRGGMVILPQDYTLPHLKSMVEYVKTRHTQFDTPIYLTPDHTIQDALNLINKRAHGAAIIVDADHKPLGIFSPKDASNRDRFTLLGDVMNHEMITVLDTATPEEVYKLLHQKHVHLAPVLNKEGRLMGVMTKSGALRATLYKPALNTKGELLTAVALGINKDLEGRTKALVEMGVDAFVLDTAHGHQKKMLEAIKIVRQTVGPDRKIIAGNVVTAKATEDFIKAGASIVKVGVGPGAVCITRMVTGMGRPQFSAVHECSLAARSLGAHVWADGGVRHPRDVALALAAGASCAMFASWLVGTHESTADMQVDSEGKRYKEHFGMASRRAVQNRSEKEDAFNRARKEYFEEGLSISRMYLKKGEESAEDILDRIASGLRSACTYAGARNLAEFYDKAVVGIQTSAGFHEGKALERGW